jgi:hypothetical protein
VVAACAFTESAIISRRVGYHPIHDVPNFKIEMKPEEIQGGSMVPVLDMEAVGMELEEDEIDYGGEAAAV